MRNAHVVCSGYDKLVFALFATFLNAGAQIAPIDDRTSVEMPRSSRRERLPESRRRPDVASVST
jgi:hypothetical protein